MPCLLFTRVAAATDVDLIAKAYPILLLPLAHTALGLCLGHLVVCSLNPAPAQRNTILCAVAFGNPLSMPLVLLTSVQTELFDPAVQANLGAAADPVVYLSLYQPLAYLLMFRRPGPRSSALPEMSDWRP